MGAVLEKPITEKETASGTFGNDDSSQEQALSWGVASMQGWRLEMEDAHLVQQAYIQSPSRDCGNNDLPRTLQEFVPGHYLFAVLDGHGGKFSAKYVSGHLAVILARQATFVRYAKKYMENSSKNNQQEQIELLKAALIDTYLELDKDLYQQVKMGTPFLEQDQKVAGNQDYVDVSRQDIPIAKCGLRISTVQLPEEDSGTTVVLILSTPQHLVCANVGDSRAVLVAKHNCKSTNSVMPLSTDHKPDLLSEQERVFQAGGYIQDGRVDGDIAISRTLGDYRFKNVSIVLNVKKTILANNPHGRDGPQEIQVQKVSSIPEITVHDRDLDNDLFLVCACDGIWDVVSNKTCANYISTLFMEGETNMGLMCEELLDYCLDLGSQDNMTALIIKFPAQITGEGGGVKARRQSREKAKKLQDEEEEEKGK